MLAPIPASTCCAVPALAAWVCSFRLVGDPEPGQDRVQRSRRTPGRWRSPPSPWPLATPPMSWSIRCGPGTRAAARPACTCAPTPPSDAGLHGRGSGSEGSRPVSRPFCTPVTPPRRAGRPAGGAGAELGDAGQDRLHAAEQALLGRVGRIARARWSCPLAGMIWLFIALCSAMAPVRRAPASPRSRC